MATVPQKIIVAKDDLNPVTFIPGEDQKLTISIKLVNATEPGILFPGAIRSTENWYGGAQFSRNGTVTNVLAPCGWQTYDTGLTNENGELLLNIGAKLPSAQCINAGNVNAIPVAPPTSSLYPMTLVGGNSITFGNPMPEYIQMCDLHRASTNIALGSYLILPRNTPTGYATPSIFCDFYRAGVKLNTTPASIIAAANVSPYYDTADDGAFIISDHDITWPGYPTGIWTNAKIAMRLTGITPAQIFADPSNITQAELDSLDILVTSWNASANISSTTYGLLSA